MSAGKSLTGMKRDKVAAVDEPVRRQRGAERPALSAGGTLREGLHKSPEHVLGGGLIA